MLVCYSIVLVMHGMGFAFSGYTHYKDQEE